MKQRTKAGEGRRTRGASSLSRPSAQASRVAITGASSFLGKNLIGLLEEDARVGTIIALDTSPPDTAGPKTRYYELDLSQPASEERLTEICEAERVTCVTHLAFLEAPTHATAWAHELESVGTMHVLNSCRRAGVPKVVMRSQTTLYGAHPTNPNFLTERHPLRARRDVPYFADKLEAERDALRFAKPGSGRTVTILRMAPVLGPTIQNAITRYFGRRLIPTLLGFDPLWQFLHEADAVAALKLAVDHDVPGTFNIVGQGVLPLSTAIKLAGRVNVPLPGPFARSVARALWVAHLLEAPPTLVDYLQYICVADGRLAAEQLGFIPVFTTREAVIDFANAQHLRDVRLLSEAKA
ncbi:MAG: NAD-dependent epimerase/dehydratase family protein [Polyangiaceae bacterium]